MFFMDVIEAQSDADRATWIRVADEVWVATALLHREHPERSDFRIGEIVQRAAQEKLHPFLRPGVRVHASLHCVANRPPNPATLKMLYATGRSTRRLYRPGDPTHPLRRGRSLPERSELPRQRQELIEWYKTEYLRTATATEPGWLDGVLSMRGVGKNVWAGEDPDEYVRKLREGWE